jgi:hypothetical protein
MGKIICRRREMPGYLFFIVVFFVFVGSALIEQKSIAGGIGRAGREMALVKLRARTKPARTTISFVNGPRQSLRIGFGG